jgi:serine phosphatase RsbU (regulator of sigma subunit)
MRLIDSFWKKLWLPSLIRRILFLSIIFLVLPYLIQSWVLYRQEYQEKVFEVKHSMELIGRAQAALLEERFEAAWDLLKKDPHIGIPIPHQESFPPQWIEVHPQEIWVAAVEEGEGRALVISTDPLFRFLEQVENNLYNLTIGIQDTTGKVVAGEWVQHGIHACFPLQPTHYKLCLSLPSSGLQSLHRARFFTHVYITLGLIALIGGGCLSLGARLFTRPLEHLLSVMHQRGEGAMDARYHPYRFGFEINDIGHHFNMAMDQLVVAEEKMRQEQKEKWALLEEMAMAKRVQYRLLPTDPFFYPVTARFAPAEQVGGDFYDYFKAQNGRHYILVADIAGKGLFACLYSLILKTAFRSAQGCAQDLFSLLQHVNRCFCDDVKDTGMFATLWIGEMDPVTRTLSFSSQGHPPAYLVRDRQISPLKTEGIPLGVTEEITIDVKTLVLEPKDRLVMYTDGIIEAHSQEGKLYGLGRLKELLLHRQEGGLDQVADLIMQDVMAFEGTAPRHDDIALIVMQVV